MENEVKESYKQEAVTETLTWMKEHSGIPSSGKELENSKRASSLNLVIFHAEPIFFLQIYVYLMMKQVLGRKAVVSKAGGGGKDGFWRTQEDEDS